MAKSKAEDWLTEDGLALLECWARDGLTDEQIADNMEIDVRTLYRWKNKHSQICQSLKKGKEVVDYKVENALLKRAMGYEYEECTYEYGILTKRVIKQVAPDTGAAMAWLKNRKPDKWRDKQQEKNDGDINKKVVIVDDLPKW